MLLILGGYGTEKEGGGRIFSGFGGTQCSSKALSEKANQEAFSIVSQWQRFTGVIHALFWNSKKILLRSHCFSCYH